MKVSINGKNQEDVDTIHVLRSIGFGFQDEAVVLKITKDEITFSLIPSKGEAVTKTINFKDLLAETFSPLSLIVEP